MRGPSGVNFISLTPGCGYGDAACQYIAGLADLGLAIKWTPTIANTAAVLPKEDAGRFLTDAIRDQLLDLWQQPVDCGVMLVDIPPFEWQHYWKDTHPEMRAFTYVAWEVERIPEDWVPALNRYRRVFVPSRFNRNALVAAGVTVPVDVVPHVGRSIRPVPGDQPWGDVSDKDFVFYTIGSWTARKAVSETVRAYLDAFSDTDPVALIIKTEAIDQIALHAIPETERQAAPPQIAMVWWTVAQIMAQYPRPAKVHLIAEPWPAREIDRLHTRGDCFVSLARSEGWGLCAFDAGLFGNPVVTTGWGGHLDFLGSDHPYLVRYRLESTARSQPDGCFLHGEDVWWAHADRAHGGELMRQVFDNRDTARQQARDLQRQLVATYSARRVCGQLAALIQE